MQCILPLYSFAPHTTKSTYPNQNVDDQTTLKPPTTTLYSLELRIVGLFLYLLSINFLDILLS